MLEEVQIRTALSVNPCLVRVEIWRSHWTLRYLAAIDKYRQDRTDELLVSRAIVQACPLTLLHLKTRDFYPLHQSQPLSKHCRAVVFANRSAFTQLRQFEPSQFDGQSAPVWVLDTECRQVVWVNRSALEFGCRENRDGLILPEWNAFLVLDALNLWGDWTWIGAEDEAIAAWRVDTPDRSVAVTCLCSGAQLEDGRQGLLMQALASPHSLVPVTTPMHSHSQPTDGDQFGRIADAIAQILAPQPSPQQWDRILEQSLAVLGNAMEVDRVGVWERLADADADQWTMRLRYEWTNRGTLSQKDAQCPWFSAVAMPPFPSTVSGWISQAEIAADPNSPDAHHAVAAIPIEVRGHCWGWLSVEDCRSRSRQTTPPTDRLWSGGEISSLQALANSMASAIARQQAEVELVQLQEQIDRRVEERTQELTRAIEQLSYNVHHDFLTGLPNRTLLMEELERSIDRLREHPQDSFAILLVDLERFKVINDSLGHRWGDRLLVEVAYRLRNCVPANALVARLGGDEFAIVLKEIHQLSEATDIAERITTDLTRPFYINNQEVFTNVRIGIALSSPEYNYAEELLRDADIVAERAKLRGQSCFAIFDTAMHDGFAEKLRLENELRRAVTDLDRGSENSQFKVVYQPIVSLATARIVGFEALLRWHHPQLGSIAPGQFIPIAEETGLIVSLGEWVLFQACRQLHIWEAQKQPRIPLKISVNISGRQFSQTNLISQIDRILEETGVRGGNLKLEVTESAIMDNADSATQMLLQLKERQIQLCMDDFGTGYSSLSYLHRFPLDTLKIDRSFVSPIKSFRDKSEILQTIVTLAHNLGMNVVAEGVETPIQKKMLRSLGCEFAQGYLFSKPVDADEASRLIVA